MIRPDQIRDDGPVYDYDLQVWTRDGIVRMCGHPERMRAHGPCCNAARFAGQYAVECMVDEVQP